MNAEKLSKMPAFPVPLTEGNFSPDECLEILERSRGVTLRQYYAGMALQGLLARPEFRCSPEDFAQTVLWYADALIAELAKPVSP